MPTHKFFLPLTFLAGASVIVWTGLSFVGAHLLAFAIVLLIAAVYCFGFLEMHRFRQTNQAFRQALEKLPEQNDTAFDLESWIRNLPGVLQNSVRQKLEGNVAHLPGPVVTPFLVGLLVMLGLLGTFLGMVDTLQGAVTALQVSTELEVIRAGLAEPIYGLGMAFGTSVAGVAASAVLGFVSMLSRRDRVIAASILDGKIASVLQKHTFKYNQQETFKAIQTQASTLPHIADSLRLLTQNIEHMNQSMGESLLSSQRAFQETIQKSYADLAESVESSLKTSLAESGRLAGDGIKPIVTDLASTLQRESQAAQQALASAAKEELSALSLRFSESSKEVATAWQSGLASHSAANSELLEHVQSSMNSLNDRFGKTTEQLISSIDQHNHTLLSNLASSDTERQVLWHNTLTQAQQQSANALSELSMAISRELQDASKEQQAAFKSVADELKAVTAHFGEQLADINAQSSTQQKAVTASLEDSLKHIQAQTSENTERVLANVTSLLQSSEDLIQTRITSEKSWLSEHGQRLEALREAFTDSIEKLRQEESVRSAAALDRLSNLEPVVAKHLQTLGQGLEAPMTRLIETASETPRAAAEVIGQLREEMSKNIERDNTFLEERLRITEDLNALSISLKEATDGQRASLENMVQASHDMLSKLSEQFSEKVDGELNKVSEATDQFSVSAVELSSLGDAFSVAVTLFNESNEKLTQSLAQIEAAINGSAERNNEQLAYYVAQAREVIDHSVLSQKEMFEEFKSLSTDKPMLESEVN